MPGRHLRRAGVGVGGCFTESINPFDWFSHQGDDAMRTFGKMALAFALLATTSAPAWAQGGRGFGGGFGGGGMLLTNKGVQQELKVSDDQATKLSALAEEQRTKGQEQRAKLQDLSQ